MTLGLQIIMCVFYAYCSKVCYYMQLLGCTKHYKAGETFYCVSTSLYTFNVIILAERAGFEPAWTVKSQPISNRCRYDRFGTSPKTLNADTKFLVAALIF